MPVLWWIARCLAFSPPGSFAPSLIRPRGLNDLSLLKTGNLISISTSAHSVDWRLVFLRLGIYLAKNEIFAAKITVLWRKQNWDWCRNLRVSVRIKLYQKFAKKTCQSEDCSYFITPQCRRWSLRWLTSVFVLWSLITPSIFDTYNVIWNI